MEIVLGKHWQCQISRHKFDQCVVVKLVHEQWNELVTKNKHSNTQISNTLENCVVASFNAKKILKILIVGLF